MKVDMPEREAEEFIKAVIQVSMTDIEGKIEQAEIADLPRLPEEKVVPVAHVLDEEFNGALIGKSL
jgi:hypothetical protein